MMSQTGTETDEIEEVLATIERRTAHHSLHRAYAETINGRTAAEQESTIRRMLREARKSPTVQHPAVAVARGIINAQRNHFIELYHEHGEGALEAELERNAVPYHENAPEFALSNLTSVAGGEGMSQSLHGP